MADSSYELQAIKKLIKEMQETHNEIAFNTNITAALEKMQGSLTAIESNTLDICNRLTELIEAIKYYGGDQHEHFSTAI